MEAEHREVHAEEAAMKSSGALKKRHMGWILDEEPRQKQWNGPEEISDPKRN
jgi:hypothetical protein